MNNGPEMIIMGERTFYTYAILLNYQDGNMKMYYLWKIRWLIIRLVKEFGVAGYLRGWI